MKQYRIVLTEEERALISFALGQGQQVPSIIEKLAAAEEFVPASEDQLLAARRVAKRLSSFDVEVDDDAGVSKPEGGDHGYWVQAWVWVDLG